MADYKINTFDEQDLNNGEKNPLFEEYAKLEYELLHNQHFSTNNPIKFARYNELKKILDIKALNKAREKIMQEIIVSDNSDDNSIICAAITNFKKTKE